MNKQLLGRFCLIRMWVYVCGFFFSLVLFTLLFALLLPVHVFSQQRKSDGYRQ